MIELVGIYVSKIENGVPKKLTAHVYLVKEDLDVRGVQVIVRGKHLFVDLPHLFGVDDGELVKYPVVSFCSDEKMQNLMQFVKTECKAFLDAFSKAKNHIDYNEDALVRKLKKRKYDKSKRERDKKKAASNAKRKERKAAAEAACKLGV